MTSAIILAGGLGTRLRSVVPDLPKPMAPINGRPFLEYQIRYWISQGVNHFVISVGYRYQVIIDFFGAKFEGAIIDYVVEKSPLGTGGGLLLASKKISHQENFLLLNGDTYFDIDLKDLTKFSQENNADWSFSLFRTSDVNRYLGMNISQNGEISSFHSNLNSSEKLVNGGVYLVNPRVLSSIPFCLEDKVSLEEDILPAAMAWGQRFFGKEYMNNFIDIGVPDDYFRASAVLGK